MPLPEEMGQSYDAAAEELTMFNYRPRPVFAGRYHARGPGRTAPNLPALGGARAATPDRDHAGRGTIDRSRCDAE